MPVDGNLLMLTIDEQSNVNVFVIIDCHRLSISSIIVLFFWHVLLGYLFVLISCTVRLSLLKNTFCHVNILTTTTTTMTLHLKNVFRVVEYNRIIMRNWNLRTVSALKKPWSFFVVCLCVWFSIFVFFFLIGSLALERPIGLLNGYGLIDANRCQLANRKSIGSSWSNDFPIIDFVSLFMSWIWSFFTGW